jgi:chromosome segregation ATPase
VNAFGTEQMSEQDRTVLQQFQQKLARLDRALSGAIQTGNDVEKRLTSMQQSLRDTPSDVSALVARTDDLQTRLREIMRALVGDSVLRRRQDITPTAINDRVNQIEDEERFSAARPTQTHIDSYNVAAQQFGEQLSKLRQLVDVELKKVEDEMEKASSPWTPGHVPEWSEK